MKTEGGRFGGFMCSNGSWRADEGTGGALLSAHPGEAWSQEGGRKMEKGKKNVQSVRPQPQPSRSCSDAKLNPVHSAALLQQCQAHVHGGRANVHACHNRAPKKLLPSSDRFLIATRCPLDLASSEIRGVQGEVT